MRIREHLVNQIVEAIVALSPEEGQLLRRELAKEELTLVPLEPSPRWDNNALTLFLGDEICRRYRLSAKNQIAVLQVFQKAHWSYRVELDKFPPKLRGQSLNDALSRLNKFQPRIRFHRNWANVFWTYAQF